MQILHTDDGTRFAVWGDKPESPAPLLLVLAAGLETMESVRGE